MAYNDDLISNYTIGKESSLDQRYSNFFMPLKLLIDIGQSKLPIMPPSESDYVEVQGQDGAIINNTVYKNRSYSLVAYSSQGITQEEKELLKMDVSLLLDETKMQPKILTFLKNGLSFKIKYMGEADYKEWKSALRITMPFEAEPYGFKLISNQFQGNGTIINDGHKELGPVIVIGPGTTNPNFKIGDTEFLWESTVPNGSELIIDNKNNTCYLLKDNTKIQALHFLQKGFYFTTIAKGEEKEVIALNNSTENNIKTFYRPEYLWLKS